jgi:type II secretory pathway component PulC
VKKTFVILLVCAVAVWGYVVAQIVVVLMRGPESVSRAQMSRSMPMAAMLARARAPLDTTFRDPFQSYLYAQKPAPVVVKTGPVKPVLKVIEPPTAVLSGILWGDEPVAILKQDGQTELVKKGAEIWGLKVIRIERNQVVVQKQGRPFTLGY